LSAEGSDTLLPDFEEIVEVRSLSLGRIAGLQAAAALRRITDDVKPSIIHTQGIRADVLVSRLPGRQRHIATVRNYAFQDYAMTYGRLRGWGMAVSHVHHLRRVDCVALVSNAIQAKLKRYLPDAVVIQNGVDLSRYSIASSDEKAALRQRLGLPR